MKRIAYTKSKGIATMLFALVGTILILSASLALEIGLVRVAKAEVQNATDSGAKAAADILGSANALVIQKAKDFVNKHTIYGNAKPQNVKVELGDWDDATKTFSINNNNPKAVRVTAEYSGKHYLAKIINVNAYTVTAESIAISVPRDIVFSVDISESMNDDSQLKSISLLGEATIKNNLSKIYQDLGSPTYGQMTWEPIYIASNNTNTVVQQLGLDNVAYPYAKGSWNKFVNYIKNDSTIEAAGYKKKYGYLTLVDYWLSEVPGFDETSDLWKTRAEPLLTAKDAVDYILATLGPTDKAALLTYNTKNGSGGLEVALTTNKQQITDVLRGDIAANTPGRQAGHWHKFTNIGSGIKNSRAELNQSIGLPERQIVLVSDGKSSWNAQGNNPSQSRQNVINQVNFAKNDDIIIYTVSMGADPDTDLMQQIADITGGIHINIPAGDSVNEHLDKMNLLIDNLAPRAVLVK